MSRHCADLVLDENAAAAIVDGYDEIL